MLKKLINNKKIKNLILIFRCLLIISTLLSLDTNSFEIIGNQQKITTAKMIINIIS